MSAAQHLLLERLTALLECVALTGHLQCLTLALLRPHVSATPARTQQLASALASALLIFVCSPSCSSSCRAFASLCDLAASASVCAGSVSVALRNSQGTIQRSQTSHSIGQRQSRTDTTPCMCHESAQSSNSARSGKTKHASPRHICAPDAPCLSRLQSLWPPDTDSVGVARQRRARCTLRHSSTSNAL